jgi:hypothetical protein
MLTEDQAFEAMRLFLHAFWQRGGSDPKSDLVDILSWTGREVWGDGGTDDPAQWHDWTAAVEAAQRGERARL